MSTKKVLITMLIILLLTNILFLPICYAAESTADEIIRDAEDFLNKGDSAESVIDTGKLKDTSSTIYKILLTIAICISVIIGAVLGFQFILGSVEGKVKVQEALVPYIVGCFVVFGAFTIWSIVVETGDNMVPTYTSADIADAELAEVREKNSEITEKINSGEQDLAKLSDEELKSIYGSTYQIDTILNHKVNGQPGRGPGSDETMSLEEAIKSLNDGQKKVYDECKKRNLLKNDGYNLER